ncbi:glycosyltransferase [Desulforamulus ruminis]|uniref:Glycosyl transferase family 2 n=1 Tax=Desulforamulus ruminis (strain ATCC 23193 / DSM 2154 / NCIMB 8452 / DL) TaxID=696281 RepID=F6DN55_DESRL|nr:glycosyltransferase [Desulforamulus ruminis]AEG60644.1 glycosyl transferase family 2 [Desulforamulus ruminis DSM 2154]
MGNRVSLCMIVRNEEENIGRCLESVAGLVDEIIVVDTGSTDETPRIAREMGARVYSFTWKDHFGEARNVSLTYATGDWILFLDADEELARESRDRLVQYTAEEQVEGYFIKIINYIGKEGWVETCPDLVFRLFRNRPEYRFRGAIHEQMVDVILEKNPQAAYRIANDIKIFHYGYLDRQIDEKDKKNRNLRIIQRELEQQPENDLLRYHYGVELFRFERYDEAAAVFIEVANGIDPQTIFFPKLLRYITMAYASSGQPAKALEVIRQALRFFPDYADLYYYGGRCCMELKQYAKATELFSQAVALPEQPPQYASFGGVRGFRSLYHLGEIAEFFLNQEEALRYYLESLRDNPDFRPSLEKIVKILDPRLNPEYTRECLKKVLDFSTPQATLLLAEIFFQQDAYRLTLDFLNDLMQWGVASEEFLFQKAYCLIQERRFLEALRILSGYTAESTLYPQVKVNELFCFWLQGKRKKVREIVETLRQMGLSKDTDNVLKLVVKAQENRKTQRKITLGEEGIILLLDILKRLLDLKEPQKAEEILSPVAPECLAPWKWDVILLYRKYGYLEKAVELAEEYLTQKRNGEVHFLLAESHQELGNFTEAELHYRYAIEQDPDQPAYYIQQIQLYEEWRKRLKKEHDGNQGEMTLCPEEVCPS